MRVVIWVCLFFTLISPIHAGQSSAAEVAGENWVLWKKTTIFVGAGDSMKRDISWDIVTVVPDRYTCERGKAFGQDYPAVKDTGKKYYSDGTWGQTFYEFYCLPETIDPRDRK